MWIKASIVAEVNDLARVFYLDAQMTQRWNAQRRDGELRMLTGWVWSAHDGSAERVGIKTSTAAYIDAYQVLVLAAERARVNRPRLRVAADNTKRRRSA